MLKFCMKWYSIFGNNWPILIFIYGAKIFNTHQVINHKTPAPVGSIVQLKNIALCNFFLPYIFLAFCIHTITQQLENTSKIFSSTYFKRRESHNVHTRETALSHTWSSNNTIYYYMPHLGVLISNTLCGCRFTVEAQHTTESRSIRKEDQMCGEGFLWGHGGRRRGLRPLLHASRPVKTYTYIYIWYINVCLEKKGTCAAPSSYSCDGFETWVHYSGFRNAIGVLSTVKRTFLQISKFLKDSTAFVYGLRSTPFNR